MTKPKVWEVGKFSLPILRLWQREREHEIGIIIQSTQIRTQYCAFWVIEYMHASFHLRTIRLFSRAAAVPSSNSQGWASPYILTNAQNCPDLIFASLMDVKWHRNVVSLMTFASKHLFTSCQSFGFPFCELPTHVLCSFSLFWFLFLFICRSSMYSLHINPLQCQIFKTSFTNQFSIC